MKIKNNQKIIVTIATTNRLPAQITTTVKRYSEQFSAPYGVAIEQALEHIEEENINGIGFTCWNGVDIQVSLA